MNILRCLLCAPFFEIGSHISLLLEIVQAKLITANMLEGFATGAILFNWMRFDKKFRYMEHTVIEDLCNCSLILRQKDLFQYRQRYNTGNVPLLTHRTLIKIMQNGLYVALIFYLATILLYLFGHLGSCYMSNFVKH